MMESASSDIKPMINVDSIFKENMNIVRKGI